MVASRANQERIQADLVASQATSEELRLSNEELSRDLQTRAGERVEVDQEPMTLPMEFPTPFSQEIKNAAIPAMLVGPCLRGTDNTSGQRRPRTGRYTSSPVSSCNSFSEETKSSPLSEAEIS